MILGFILAATIAVILWASQPGKPSSRFAGLTFFTAGAGFIVSAVEMNFIAYRSKYSLRANWYEDLIFFISDVSLYSSIYVFPYCYLMFGLTYSERFRPKITKYVGLALFIPVVLPLFWPVFLNPEVVLAWVSVYIFTSSLLLILNYVKERIQEKKRHKGITAFFFVSLTSIDLFTGYVFEVFDYSALKHLNLGLVILAFMMFVYFIIRNGLLGIRFHMERQQIGQSMSGLSTGSFKLSHALKNQISKIKVYGLIIRKMADESENADLRIQSDRIMNVSADMLLMMNRIEMQSNAIVMNELEVDVEKMMDSVIESFDLASAEIKVDKDYPFRALLKCDDVHMKEVLNNLFSNAIDAAHGSNNRLWLGYYETGRTFVIYVKDNGCGIPKQDIRKVIQPFYTTKKSDAQHFGMGLSYCYFVVARHQGDLRILSEAGRGTEVQLRFKRSRLVSM